MGILWRDINVPLCAQIELNFNYYSGVFHIMQIIPIHVQHITMEADPSLTMFMFNPSISDWTVRFQVRQIHSVITRFDHLQASKIHPQTMRFSKFISRNIVTSTHIHSSDIMNLFSTFARVVGVL